MINTSTIANRYNTAILPLTTAANRISHDENRYTTTAAPMKKTTTEVVNRIGGLNLFDDDDY